MTNFLYINTSIILIIIIFVLIICLTKDEIQKDYKDIVLHKNEFVYVPKHVLRALIIKYKNKLAYNTKKNIKSDLTHNKNKFKKIEKILLTYIKLTYNIKLNLNPYEIEKYILDERLNTRDSISNIFSRKDGYDEEIININEYSEYPYLAGKIVYLLERILYLDHTSKKEIHIPLHLDEIESLLNNIVDKPIIRKGQIKTEEELKIYISSPQDNEFDNMLLPQNDIIDRNEYFLIKNLPKPKTCSKYIRHNLKNYITDIAAQDIPSPFNVDDDDNQKAKNTKEATSSWNKNKGLNYMLYTTEQSDLSPYNDHEESDNRIMADYLMCVPNDINKKKLLYDNMRASLKINDDMVSGKQSLTDKWDYLENQFLTN